MQCATPAWRAGWLLIGAFALGCGSKGAVSLGARIENARVAVQSVALGTALSGEFDLVLDLGQAAPEPTEVSLGTFAIRNAGGPILDGLPLSASKSFPLVVDVGTSQIVHMTLDDGEIVEGDLKASICGGEVWYFGTVSDTLSEGRPTVATSTMFKPACP